MKLISDFIKEGEVIKKAMNKYLKNMFRHIAMQHIIFVLQTILPAFCMNSYIEMMSEKIDLFFSNIPGPKKPIYCAGNKIECIIPVANVDHNRFFNAVVTYDGQFSICTLKSKVIDIDSDQFSNYIDEEIENFITLNKL